MQYFLSIFFGTFVLEDVALASALALVADGKMDLMPAFLACFLGISIGDFGLYLIGWIVHQFGLEARFKMLKKLRARFVNEKKADLLTFSIIISRFVPGTRVPTYLVSGLFRYPFFRFVILTAFTVFGWVALAFAFSRTLNSVLMNHWVISLFLVLGFLQLVKYLVPKLSDHWERKALLLRWRMWTHFEFWPATVFYLPIVPLYIYLALRHRSFLLPFYANPEIENGGLIGESKWDFLRHLSSQSPSTLKSIQLPKQDDFLQARDFIFNQGFAYPFILKPDIGQRGFGVRIIRDDFDLTEYLLLAEFDMIVQRLSLFPNEAGIFYVRQPEAKNGFIFSITDKKFPLVTGDGKSRLGDLILSDRRARIMASTYFERHRENLDRILKDGEVLLLSECGNHCQGAIFLNGAMLKTPGLEETIDLVAKQIPQFHFGRFDIRYQDADSLKKGQNFEIVEVNGAGAEATHIWDGRENIFNAYKTLFQQWTLLFAVGASVRAQKIPKRVSIKLFLKESIRVFFRKEPLSTSS